MNGIVSLLGATALLATACGGSSDGVDYEGSGWIDGLGSSRITCDEVTFVRGTTDSDGSTQWGNLCRYFGEPFVLVDVLFTTPTMAEPPPASYSTTQPGHRVNVYWGDTIYQAFESSGNVQMTLRYDGVRPTVRYQGTLVNLASSSDILTLDAELVADRIILPGQP